MAKSKSNDKKVKEFFKLLGIEEKFELTENEETIDIVMESDDPGMIIGHHGDTLDSLQLILALILAKENEEFKRVSLEVGDYRKSRSEYLKNLALQTKEKVISEQREIFLPALKPWERREVHMFLSEDSDVITESVGEGKERTLAVKPR